MKPFKFIAALVAIATLFFICHKASAQTNVPATFFSSAEGYLTSFNTNFTFSGVSFEASTGYKQVTGVNAASFIDAQYNLSSGLNFDASLQFSGVGSPLNAYQAGIGYAVIQHFDTEVNVFVLGGYDTVRKQGLVEPGLTLKKKLTTNTFLEIGASLPAYFGGAFNNNPTFRIGTGFTF